MRLIIEPNYEQLSKWAANYVAAKIKAANPTAEKPFVLGLPTGSSPLGMYKNLIELNKQGVVSFQNVITFNRMSMSAFRKIIRKAIILSCGIISSVISISNRRT